MLHVQFVLAAPSSGQSLQKAREPSTWVAGMWSTLMFGMKFAGAPSINIYFQRWGAARILGSHSDAADAASRGTHGVLYSSVDSYKL